MHRFASWSISSVLALFFAGIAQAGPAHPSNPTRPTGDGEAEELFLRAARVIVRPGEVLENASVLVQAGRIVAVGTDLEKPEGAREVQGEVVCAAFFDPWSSLGLSSTAHADAGTAAGTRSLDAVDLFESEQARAEALHAGVTATRSQAGAQSAIGGVGVVLRLAPELGEGAVVLEDANVGASVGLTKGGNVMDIFDRVEQLDKLVRELEAGRKYSEDRVEYRYELEEWQKAIAEKEEELEKDFKKAKKDREKDKEKAAEKGKEFKEKRYKEDKKPKKPSFDADKEAMARVVEGELSLVVHANRAGELRNLLELTEDFDRMRLVIAGGTEAMHVAEELAERDIPVIVWPAPLGTNAGDEHAGHDLSLAAQLEGAGVEVLIGGGGRWDSTRDLPLLASLAVGHGLSRESAFAALTERAARVFDVGDRLGVVEAGADAELLVLDGEPLVSTTRVQYVVSAGRLVVTPER